MPVGRQNASNTKRKEVVSEKVREIKQRQQNWLVQREQSKSKETIVNKNKSNSPHKPTSSASSSSKTLTYQPTIQTSKPPKGDQGKKRVSDTFNNWKKARENNHLDEDHDTSSIRSDAESELERLVSPDIDNSKIPVAEEEFGSLADQIASRVKQNMGMSEPYLNKNSEIDEVSVMHTFSEEASWGPSRCKTFTQNEPAFNHCDNSGNSGNSGLASHNCLVCKKLMFSSEHIPLMIIPCGHTLCKACSEGNTHCPECDCAVVSLTVNIMLQQLIQDYHSHSYGVSSTTTHKSHQRGGSGRRLITESRNSNSDTRYVEDNRRNKTASYQSQLVNLQTRQSVLSNEHGDLVQKLSKLTKQIQHTSLQTKSIMNQEHEVKKTIIDLQDKLSALELHRKQYESQLTELHDEKSETEGKITLLSGTLASLSREVEKVNLLAEGEQNMD